jgi:hypothetical protein
MFLGWGRRFFLTRNMLSFVWTVRLSSMCLLTWVMDVLSSTFWFIINLFINLLFFVVVSRRPSLYTFLLPTQWHRRHSFLYKEKKRLVLGSSDGAQGDVFWTIYAGLHWYLPQGDEQAEDSRSVLFLWWVSVLHTYLLTELSPSWEASNCAAIQEIPSNF